MHELSIAESLLQIIKDRASEEGISRIHKINLKIGEYSGIFTDALIFAFEMIAKDTISEGALINIEKSPGDELQIMSFEGDP
jgi:hydrogenase nickel incorporation protein HypA/HybF